MQIALAPMEGLVDDILRDHHWNSILLVSSPYHMKRALLVWRKVAPGAVAEKVEAEWRRGTVEERIDAMLDLVPLTADARVHHLALVVRDADARRATLGVGDDCALLQPTPGTTLRRARRMS